LILVKLFKNIVETKRKRQLVFPFKPTVSQQEFWSCFVLGERGRKERIRKRKENQNIFCFVVCVCATFIIFSLVLSNGQFLQKRKREGAIARGAFGVWVWAKV